MDKDHIRSWLQGRCANEKTWKLVFYYYVCGETLHDAARKAGFSPGQTGDPDKEKKQLASAGGRAIHKPAAQRLYKDFCQWRDREDRGTNGNIASKQEILEYASIVIRSGKSADKLTASEIGALKILLDHHNKTPKFEWGGEGKRALIDQLCGHKNPFFNVMGLCLAQMFRNNLEFRDWEVPEPLKVANEAMEANGVTWVDAINLV